MNIKSSMILGLLSLIVVTSFCNYFDVNEIQAVENKESSIDILQNSNTSTESLTYNTNDNNSVNENLQLEEVSQSNNNTSIYIEYDPNTNIGTLKERIQLYEHLTSQEYNDSISETIVNEDGTVTYRMPADAEYYAKACVTLPNGEIIQFIRYTDKNGNYVRLHNDGIVELLVGEKYNQYYVDQLKDYAIALNEVNQELGTDYTFDFQESTFDEAQGVVDYYKNMSLDEFKIFMGGSITESEKIYNNVE